MDHIPIPENPRYPPVSVPYICRCSYTTCSRVANVSFMEYPTFRGFDSRTLRIDEDEVVDDFTEIEAFLQEWLFFGLVSELARIVGVPFIEDDFVTKQEGESGAKLTTKSLVAFLSLCARNLEKRGARWLSEHMNELTALPATASTALQVYKRALFTRYTGCGNLEPFIHLLCLSMLLEEVVHSLMLPDVALRPETAPDYDTLYLSLPSCGISDRILPMLRQRWHESRRCPFDRARHHHLNSRVYYLTMLPDRTPERRDHSRCTADSCVADQIDEDTYETAHIPECKSEKSCPFIGINVEDMFKIIEEDGIPILYIDIDGEDDGAGVDDNQDQRENPLVNVRVTKLGMGEPFVAISHVWSNGMGNPHENKLPECQLRRLRKWANACGIGNCSQKNVGIWIDTLCVPVSRSVEETSSRIWKFPALSLRAIPLGIKTSPPDDPSRRRILRKEAIKRMAEVYRKAEVVLAVDEELCSSGGGDMERRVRCGTSSWTRRLWTLQEAFFAKNVLIQYRDKAINLGDLSYSSGGYPRPVADMEFIGLTAIGITKSVFMMTPEDAIGIRFFCLLNALYRRSTSKSSDEAVCLSSMLGLDTEAILNTAAHGHLRLQKVFTMIKQIPTTLLFNDAPRMPSEGFGWAPLTVLSGHVRRSHAPASTQATTFGTNADGSTLEQPDLKFGIVHEQGLLVNLPGIVIVISASALAEIDSMEPYWESGIVIALIKKDKESIGYFRLSYGNFIGDVAYSTPDGDKNRDFVSTLCKVSKPVLLLSGAETYAAQIGFLDVGVLVSMEGIVNAENDLWCTKYVCRVSCEEYTPHPGDEERLKRLALQGRIPQGIMTGSDTRWLIG